MSKNSSDLSSDIFDIISQSMIGTHPGGKDISRILFMQDTII